MNPRSEPHAFDAPQHFGADHPGRVSALRYYLEIARRRKLAVIAAFLTPLGAAVALGFLKPELYQGGAQVVLNRQNLANALTNTPDPASYANDFLRVVQTQAAIARSPDVARRVVRAVPEADLTFRQLISQSTVESQRDTDLLQFRVWHADRRAAADLTTAYAEQFVAYRRQQDTASLQDARAQLDRRLTQLERDAASNRQLISQLAAKEQELRTLEALQTSNVTVTARAAGARQISPRPKKYLILGLLAGLGLAAAVAWALEALDTRIRSAEEIEQRLGVPFIACRAPLPTISPAVW